MLKSHSIPRSRIIVPTGYQIGLLPTVTVEKGPRYWNRHEFTLPSSGSCSLEVFPFAIDSGDMRYICLFQKYCNHEKFEFVFTTKESAILFYFF